VKEESTTHFYDKYRRTLLVLAVPVWVVFIVLVYIKSHPHDRSSSATNVLRVGALPVT
jgi:hypothetical protein